jgi:hypothetical protein
MFSLQHNWRRGHNSSFPEAVWGDAGKRELAQRVYTHVSKCKNDKIKEKKYYYNLIYSIDNSIQFLRSSIIICKVAVYDKIYFLFGLITKL